MAWATKDNHPSLNLPEWKRTAGLDTNGDVWLPAGICTIESASLALLKLDNEPYVYNEDHLFVRTSWLRRRCPIAADIIDVLESNFLEYTRTPEFAKNEWHPPELRSVN